MRAVPLVLLSLLLGCGAAPSPGAGTGREPQIRYYRLVRECADKAACEAIKAKLCETAPCDGDDGWTWRPLFRQQAGQTPPAAWAPFKLFEWRSRQGQARGAFLDGLAWLGPDAAPPRVSAQAAQPGDAAGLGRRLLASPWTWALGRPRLPAPEAPSAVHVALLDTGASPDSTAPSGSHAADLEAILQKGVCGGRLPCLRVQRWQALDLRADTVQAGTKPAWLAQPDVSRRPVGFLPTAYRLEARDRVVPVPQGKWDGAGAFGDPGSVAEAVWASSAAWDASRNTPRVPRVIVLPVGWQLEGPLVAEAEWSAGSRAALAAIDHAVCAAGRPRGNVALVAASGNRDLVGGAGPLAPAVFASRLSCEPFAYFAAAGVGQARAPVQAATAPPASACPKNFRCAPCVAGPSAIGPVPCCSGRPVPNAVGAIPIQRPLGNSPRKWAWGGPLRAPQGKRWTGTSVATAVLAGALVRGLRAGDPLTKVTRRLANGWVRFCDGDDTCGPADRPAFPTASDPLTAPVLGALRSCGGAAAHKPTVTMGARILAGPGMTRVDPQPDTPLCDVCTLAQTGTYSANFKLRAKTAAWPESHELVSNVELKITYTDGTPAHYVSVGPFTSTPDYRHEMDETSEIVVAPVSLSGQYAKIDKVTLVGNLDHYTYTGPRTVYEPVDVP